MSETMTPTTDEEAEARALAAQVGLEYREPSAVAIDPRALSVLPASECRRLRAVPLAATAGSAVIGVSDPSDERLDAVRALTGPGTSFVLLADRTLDALLRSRMFTGGASATEPTPEPLPVQEHEQQFEAQQQVEDEHEVEDHSIPTADEETRADVEESTDPEPPAVEIDVPAEEPAAADPPPAPVAATTAAPPVSLAADSQLVDAIVKALEPKLRSLATHAPTTPASGQPQSDSIWDPVARVDASIEAWSNLRAALETIGEELDSSRQSLREVKEQLSASHASNDQNQRRIDALEAELTERKTLVDEARLRLQDAAKALGEREHGLNISDDLL